MCQFSVQNVTGRNGWGYGCEMQYAARRMTAQYVGIGLTFFLVILETNL